MGDSYTIFWQSHLIPKKILQLAQVLSLKVLELVLFQTLNTFMIIAGDNNVINREQVRYTKYKMNAYKMLSDLSHCELYQIVAQLHYIYQTDTKEIV